MKTDKLIDELQAIDIREVESNQIARMVVENLDGEMAARFNHDGQDYLSALSERQQDIYEYIKDQTVENIEAELRDHLRSRTFRTMSAENNAFRRQIYQQVDVIDKGRNIKQVKSVPDIVNESAEKIAANEKLTIAAVIRNAHTSLSRHVQNSTGIKPVFERGKMANYPLKSKSSPDNEVMRKNGPSM